MKKYIAHLCIFFCLFFLLPACTPTAPATSTGGYEIWYVSLSGDDENICSDPSTPCRTIYEAMQQASPGDRIEIGPGTFSDFRDFAGNRGLIIDKNLSLVGAGKENTILDGSGLGGFVVRIEPDTSVSISNLTIQNGEDGMLGYGISVWGNLNLSNTAIKNNSGVGIGIFETSSPLTIIIRNSEIINNQLGGIIEMRTVDGGERIELRITDSKIANNQGPGIYNFGDLVVIQTTIDNNLAGGEVILGGPGTYNASGIINKEGGVVTIEGTTISNNRMPADRTHTAIWNEEDMTISNSTISSNAGFGIHSVAGMLNIFYSTIVNNSMDGVYADDAHIENSIIAGNGSGPSRKDCFIIRFTYAGRNMDSDNTCLGLEPEIMDYLGPLADNGGSTKTHALLLGSPAIDGTSGDCLATDQRGITRPQGSACDVGAYEFNIIMEDLDLEIPERCDYFETIDMSFMLLDITSDSLASMYVRMPGGVPGGDHVGLPGDSGGPLIQYNATLGDLSSEKCAFEGYPERLYCYFTLNSAYLNTVQPFDLYVNGCFDPIFSLPGVSLKFATPPTPKPTCDPMIQQCP